MVVGLLVMIILWRNGPFGDFGCCTPRHSDRADGDCGAYGHQDLAVWGRLIPSAADLALGADGRSVAAMREAKAHFLPL